MLPHDGVGGTTPSPRNDIVASKAMEEGINKVAYTIKVAATFGRISTNMIRRLPAPSERAARTNSCSRIESACALTTRPTDAQLKKAITTMLIVRLGPTTATSARAKTRKGRDSTT